MSAFRKSNLFAAFSPKVVPEQVVLDDGVVLDVFVKQLSAAQIFKLQKENADAKGERDAKAFATALVAEALCDKDGQALLVDEDDMAAFVEMTAVGFNRIAEAVLRAVGVGQRAEEGKG